MVLFVHIWCNNKVRPTQRMSELNVAIENIPPHD